MKKIDLDTKISFSNLIAYSNIHFIHHGGISGLGSIINLALEKTIQIIA